MVFPRPAGAFLSAFLYGGNHHFLLVSEVTLGRYLALFSSCLVALGVLFVAVHCLGAVAWLLLGSCMLLKVKFHVCVCVQ